VKHAILKELGVLDEIEWLPTGGCIMCAAVRWRELRAASGFDAAYDALAARFPDKSQRSGNC